MHTLEQLRSGALSGLRRVELTGASTGGLRHFPTELFDLADTLEVLDLSGNQLSELPPDLGRLHRLQALFCSGNPFTTLPPALGDCAELSQVGFRGCGLVDVPEAALPTRLRWLTLTDNHISTLPPALFERPALQKLMLAGNRLQDLPHSVAAAQRLELLRLSANGLRRLPPVLAELPRLAWLAWAGNPLPHPPAPVHPSVAWQDLQLGTLLGEGASGQVHAVQRSAEPTGDVALKLFKGTMTSDGLPEHEMAACLSVGGHPQLMGALARLEGHPDGRQGLLLPRLPGHWQALAGPPSLASCSRDVYDADRTFPPATVLRLAQQVAQAAQHLHHQGWLHGDLYAHNVLWDGGAGQAVLSDLGAASPLPAGPASVRWQRLDVLAWGCLLGELLARCPVPPIPLQTLQQACVQPTPAHRPLMSELLDPLAQLSSTTL